MAIDVTEQPRDSAQELKQLLREDRPQHPALARVHDQIVAIGERETGSITSYDRMHHRHNRS